MKMKLLSIISKLNQRESIFNSAEAFVKGLRVFLFAPENIAEDFGGIT